jgi:hypothetical protein
MRESIQEQIIKLNESIERLEQRDKTHSRKIARLMVLLKPIAPIHKNKRAIQSKAELRAKAHQRIEEKFRKKWAKGKDLV